MDAHSVAVGTITWARSPAEEKTILRALGMLATLGLPVITADAGSRPSFIAALHKLRIQIICPREKGLVPQVKASLRAALDASDAPFVLYTEPDKHPFFAEALHGFLRKAQAQPSSGLVFASRNPASFATFPSGQRKAEQMMNDAAALVARKAGDYCYGPILLSRAAASLAQEAPDHLGWGWRFWLLGKAVREKIKITTVKLSAACPREQRHENTREDQIFRLKQLKQNLEGLFLGSEKT
ncbi:MAG TPA: hypothetical protein VK633_08085 [Verrucomicrobiae bacterium]|nr:hypothetical protein [Verrucomicrobiae bacterium]